MAAGGLFQIEVALKPEGETSTLMTGGPPGVAELHLRIMRLEAILTLADGQLAVLEPLVPGLATTRAEIARALDRPVGKFQN